MHGVSESDTTGRLNNNKNAWLVHTTEFYQEAKGVNSLVSLLLNLTYLGVKFEPKELGSQQFSVFLFLFHCSNEGYYLPKQRFLHSRIVFFQKFFSHSKI